MARSSAICRLRSAPPRPEPVNLTRTRPTVMPRTMAVALNCGADACAANPGECATTRPALSRIWTSAPVRAARSSTGDRSAVGQLSLCSHAAAAATAIAVVSSWRCLLARPDTSAAAKAAVRPARSATASGRPSASPRAAGRCGGPAPPSAIAGEAQPVTAAQHCLDDPGVGGLLLDLAAHDHHVRVDGALVPLELD